VGGKTSKNRRVPDSSRWMFENHRDINLDTHHHRQTDQRALVEIIQRPSVWAGSPMQNLSVRPSDCPGRFCRSIKTQNRRVRQTDARTHGLREFIYKIAYTYVWRQLESNLAINNIWKENFKHPFLGGYLLEPWWSRWALIPRTAPSWSLAVVLLSLDPVIESVIDNLPAGSLIFW